LDPSFNVTDVSDLQLEKHHLQSISNDAGIIIDFTPVRRNADSSIRRHCNPDSNLPGASDLHDKKQDLHNT
jgi:hypothetical protein